MQEVAQRLKSLRESVGVSQAKLAALMGATQASVNRYENGQSSPPLKILRWYADFFDVSLVISLPERSSQRESYTSISRKWWKCHYTGQQGTTAVCRYVL